MKKFLIVAKPILYMEQPDSSSSKIPTIEDVFSYLQKAGSPTKITRPKYSMWGDHKGEEEIPAVDLVIGGVNYTAEISGLTLRIYEKGGKRNGINVGSAVRNRPKPRVSNGATVYPDGLGEIGIGFTQALAYHGDSENAGANVAALDLWILELLKETGVELDLPKSGEVETKYGKAFVVERRTKGVATTFHHAAYGIHLLEDGTRAVVA